MVLSCLGTSKPPAERLPCLRECSEGRNGSSVLCTALIKEVAAGHQQHLLYSASELIIASVLHMQQLSVLVAHPVAHRYRCWVVGCDRPVDPHGRHFSNFHLLAFFTFHIFTFWFIERTHGNHQPADWLFTGSGSISSFVSENMSA